MEEPSADDGGLSGYVSGEEDVGLGHFRRHEGEEGSCLVCGEGLKELSEGEMLSHLAEKHPEFSSAEAGGVLTIHEARKEEEEEEQVVVEEEETTTTVLIVGGKEGGEVSEEEVLQAYFKETAQKDVLECRLCAASLPSSDTLKHILEEHEATPQQIEEGEDISIDLSIQEEAPSLFNERKRAFSEEDVEEEGLLLDDPLDDTLEEEAPSKRPRLSRNKDTRSLTWQFFEKVVGGETEEVRCHLCDKRYHTAGGSTTVMLRHLKREHPIDLRHLKEDMSLNDDKEEDPRRLLKRTSRSLAWAYFMEGSESNTVLCRLCGKSYSYTDSSTGIMLRHLRRQHEKEYKMEMMNREAEEGSGTQSGVLPTKKPPRKSQSSRSSVWSYFRRSGPTTVKCNLCDKDYSNIGGSTSAMIRHLKKSHKEESSREDLGGKAKPDKIVLDEVYTLLVKDQGQEEMETEEEEPAGDREKMSVSERILLEGISLEGYEGRHSDVQIICKDGHVVRSHQLILASTSLFMYEILKGAPPTEEDVIISAPDFEGETFKAFLDKIYIGGDSLTEGMLDIVNHFGFRVDFVQYPNRKKYPSETLRVYGQQPTTTTVESIVTTQQGESSYGDAKVIAVVQQSIPTPPVREEPGKSKRKSAIWNYFVQGCDKGTSTCLECNRSVGSKQYSTSSMIKHLQRHHESLYNKFCEENSSKVMGEEVSPSSAVSKVPLDPQKSLQEKTCPVCLKVFCTRNKMIVHHRAVHLRIKGYTCDICGKSYSRVDTLKDHVASTHSSECPSFLCKFCGKTFKRRATRFRHERFHRNDRRHQCSFCPKKFFTTQTLRNHERTHTGEKPYECNECSRRFTMQHQLTTHMRIHTGDKPYSCPYCPETFKHSSAKNKHVCPNMPREEAFAAGLVGPRRKTLSSMASSSGLSTATIIEETTTEVMLPLNTSHDISATTTYHTVVKESVLKDISTHMELANPPS